MKTKLDYLNAWIEELKSGKYTSVSGFLWRVENSDGACCLGVLDYCFISRRKNYAISFPKYYPEQFEWIEQIWIANFSKVTMDKVDKYLKHVEHPFFISREKEVMWDLANINDESVRLEIKDYSRVIDVLRILSEDSYFQQNV